MIVFGHSCYQILKIIPVCDVRHLRRSTTVVEKKAGFTAKNFGSCIVWSPAHHISSVQVSVMVSVIGKRSKRSHTWALKIVVGSEKKSMIASRPHFLSPVYRVQQTHSYKILSTKHCKVNIKIYFC